MFLPNSVLHQTLLLLLLIRDEKSFVNELITLAVFIRSFLWAMFTTSQCFFFVKQINDTALYKEQTYYQVYYYKNLLIYSDILYFTVFTYTVHFLTKTTTQAIDCLFILRATATMYFSLSIANKIKIKLTHKKITLVFYSKLKIMRIFFFV